MSPHIICVDGSLTKLDQNFVDSLEKNILYFHKPNASLTDRFQFIVDKISTKYSMLHADDEFHLPHALSQCVKEIEKCDLACCLGRCLEFIIENNSIIARPWKTFHTSFEDYSIMDESAIVRVLNHLNPYVCATTYAVTKSDIFKNNLSAFKNIQKDDVFFELLYAICTVFQGKIKVINVLSWLRSNENQPHRMTAKKADSGKENLIETILNDSFRTNPAIKNLSNHLCSLNAQYNQKDLNDVLYSAFRAYAKQASLSFKVANLYNNNDIPLSAEKRILQETIGTWRDRDFWPPNVLDLIGAASLWQKKGIDSGVSEIQEIQDLILRGYSKF